MEELQKLREYSEEVDYEVDIDLDVGEIRDLVNEPVAAGGGVASPRRQSSLRSLWDDIPLPEITLPLALLAWLVWWD